MNPAFPLKALTRKGTISERLELLVRLLAKDVGNGLTNEFLSRHADHLGIFTVGIEVAAIAVYKSYTRRNSVQECEQLRLLETGVGVFLARCCVHRPSLTYM